MNSNHRSSHISKDSDKTNKQHYPASKNLSVGEASITKSNLCRNKLRAHDLHDKEYNIDTTISSINQTNSRAQTKKFSSRNSLRSAQIRHDTDSKAKSSISTIMDCTTREELAAFLNNKGGFDPRDFVQLEALNFIKEFGDFCYCILCGKRERKTNSSSIQRHLKSDNHSNKYRKLRDLLTQQTPPADSLVMETIRHLLQSWYDEHSLSDGLYDKRLACVYEFQAILNEINPECCLRLFGSYYTKTALRTSNINLELIHPASTKLFGYDPRAKDSVHHKLIDPEAEFGNQFNNHIMHYDLITNASDILYKTACAIEQSYSSVKTFTLQSGLRDLNNKVPTLYLRHEPTKTLLEISCNSDTNYKFSELIQLYLSLDDRARKLSIIVKYWAKICHISEPKQGTLTPATYTLLIIYYLQRTEPPILPCLHDILANSKNSDKIKPVSEALVKDFENLFVSKLETGEDKKTSSQRPVFKINQNVGEHVDVDEKNLDQCVEDEQNEEEIVDLNIDQQFVYNLQWQSENQTPLHELFVDFLKFIGEDLSKTEQVISIRTLKPIFLSSKRWNTQLKAIEHPISPKTNLSRSIGSQRSFEYILEAFYYSYYYLTSIPMDTQLKPTVAQADPKNYVRLYVNLHKLEFYFSMREKSITKQQPFDAVSEMFRQNVFDRDVEVVYNLLEYALSKECLKSLPKRLASSYKLKSLVPSSPEATTFCWFCKRNGHSKDTCSKGRIEKPECNSLSFDNGLDSEANLDDGFYKLYVNDLITPKFSQQHQVILTNLTRIIRLGTGIDCKLELFGSTVNLLGSYDSDLDICMTIEGNLTGEGVNCREILQDVQKILENTGDVYNMEPVLTARVPILKFEYGKNQKFKIDLSMYNLCAIYNSKLLKTYVLIDHRVAKLIYLVKRYAKACGIADASRGSLSSYAWSLLAIHFLQQIQPQILPVLQETGKNMARPHYGVLGWDVWFYDDYNSIKMPPNNLSITQLFKMFLIYYGDFNFELNVVSIRTSRLLTKFQKNWTDCMMAIEDPFELTYNLSSRLDDQMAIYIMNSFSRTYNYVVRAQKDLVRKKMTKNIPLYMIKNIFDGHSIMGCDPPRRGCRFCFRVGHRVKDCPEAKRNRQKFVRDDNRIRNEFN